MIRSLSALICVQAIFGGHGGRFTVMPSHARLPRNPPLPTSHTAATVPVPHAADRTGASTADLAAKSTGRLQNFDQVPPPANTRLKEVARGNALAPLGSGVRHEAVAEDARVTAPSDEGKTPAALSTRGQPLLEVVAKVARQPRAALGAAAALLGVGAAAVLVSRAQKPKPARRGQTACFAATARRGTALGTVPASYGAPRILEPDEPAEESGQKKQYKHYLDENGILVSEETQTVEAEDEVRFNTIDNKPYTWAEYERKMERLNFSYEEITRNWNRFLTYEQVQAANDARKAAAAAGGATAQEPSQVKEWRRVWAIGPLGRMWTRADLGHVHAASGAIYSLLGGAFVLDTMMHDISKVFGDGTWTQHLTMEMAMAALGFGALNALSGLQPALLPGPKGPAQALGFGDDGDLKTGGFVNASLFYFVLLYQAVRALDSFPSILAPLDVAVGGITLAAMCHAGFILEGWVRKGAIERVDALVLPPLLNLPVSLHLLFEGKVWIDRLVTKYPNFPEAFFCANFNIAFALSMVTFLLSLHERRVVSQELRNFFMVTFPLLVFLGTIPLRIGALIPEWLHKDLPVMFTLIPPQ